MALSDGSRPLCGCRIGLFGKGGSGKSTITILLARALRSAGYEVCVLDADSTNVGLHKALGISSPPRGLVDYFGGLVFLGGTVTCPVDDPERLPGARVRFGKLPAEYRAASEEGVQLLTVGKLADYGMAAGCDGPMAKVARDLSLEPEGEAPVTLVDCKAGYEDAARGIITGLDWALVVVDPTVAGMQMARDMHRMAAQLKEGVLPATAHLESPVQQDLAKMIFRHSRLVGVLTVLNKVWDPSTEQFMLTRLAEWGIRPSGIIRQQADISLAWLKGTRLTADAASDVMSGVVEELEHQARNHPPRAPGD